MDKEQNTVEALLYKTLNKFAAVQAGDYESNDAQETYITFNYFTTPDDYGDDEPGHEVYSVQVHYFCPSRENSIETRNKIKKALKAAGFTHPSTTDATDADGQHHVIECMIAAGVE